MWIWVDVQVANQNEAQKVRMSWLCMLGFKSPPSPQVRPHSKSKGRCRFNTAESWIDFTPPYTAVSGGREVMEPPRAKGPARDIRKTCDHCRKRKIKCSNENPCARCHRFGLPCRYSPTRPIGRPSKRRGTSPNQCSSAAACPNEGPNEGPLFESLDIPEDFDSAMTLDTLGAPMTFPTPPDEFSWSEWSALDAMMSAAYPPNATSQNQHVQAHGEKSQVVDGVNNPDSNTQCQCGEMVREHMNNRTSTHDLPRIVARQRKSAELAQKILDCNNCGGINNAPSQIAGNVLLFGAVMTEATSSCQSFIRDLEQRAFVPDDEQSNTQICLALMDPNDHHIEYKLDRQYVLPLAKVLLGIETDKLSRICIAFITRQWRVHERGHEGCQAGATCRKLKTTQTSCPADFCPRSIEPASFFSCFRTARHLQSLISTLQKDLE